MPSETPTAWAVICKFRCNKVYLTREEYDRQLSYPDKLWICPECGFQANWDDDNYEEWIEKEDVFGKEKEARIEFTDDVKPHYLLVDREKATFLYAYFLDVGYISQEFHPEIHKFVDELKEFLK